MLHGFEIKMLGVYFLVFNTLEPPHPFFPPKTQRQNVHMLQILFSYFPFCLPFLHVCILRADFFW